MIHGGDIYRNKINYDFSVNINPLGMPQSIREALIQAVDECVHYPDIKAETLKAAIAEMTGQETKNILVGNGASELFMAVVHALNPKKVLIPVPSFYGYEWAASGREIVYYEMGEDDNFTLTEPFLDYLTTDIDMLFLANPNNPTGHTIDSHLLHQILEKCLKNNIYILLDECFIEFVPEWQSMTCRHLIEQFDHLIIVNAFTKIFAMPGVRLGYMLSHNIDVMTKVSYLLPEWNTSTFAQMAGTAAAKEIIFLEKTRQYLEAERQYLSQELSNLGVKVYPSQTDFLLLRTELPLYDILLKQGILIRNCSNFRGLGKNYYRIAVKTRRENEVIIEQIRKNFPQFISKNKNHTT